MKNIIVKTIVITLISFIAAIALAFGVVALCAPGFLGGIFDGAGFDSASVFFYEKQYERTGDIDDLNTLVLKLDVEDDSERAEKYYKIILEHQDFDSLLNNQTESDLNISSKDFYAGQYALSLAFNNKFDNALDFALEFVNSSYSLNNPFRVLIYDFISAEKQSEIELMGDALSSLNPTNSEDINLLASDKLYILNLINN